MEQFERLALTSFDGIGPSKWFRYVDDTWVLIKQSELDKFFDHINNIDKNIKVYPRRTVRPQISLLRLSC